MDVYSSGDFYHSDNHGKVLEFTDDQLFAYEENIKKKLGGFVLIERKNPNLCIALSGKTGSGKDTVAKILSGCYGFTEYSFGEPIRDFMRLALPNIDYHVDYRARQAIMEIAEAPKKISPRCWAYVLTEKISNNSFPPMVVISDLRFRVELTHLRDTIIWNGFGGGYDLFLGNVICDHDRHREEIMEEEIVDHEIEKKMEEDPGNTEHLSFNFDFEINNSNGIFDTHRQLREVLRSLGVKGA